MRMTQAKAMVLRAISAGRRYGFDIMETCGLPSGTVYPALRRMEKAGLLKAVWEEEAQAHAQGRPRRKTYRLTPAGEAIIPEAERKLDEVRQRLGAHLPPPGSEPG